MSRGRAVDRKTASLARGGARPILGLALLPVLLSVAACGSTPPSGPVVPTLQANLTAVPDGSVEFTPSADGVIATLKTFGFPLGRALHVAVRQGSCLAPTPESVAVFPDTTPDAAGRIDATLSAPPSAARSSATDPHSFVVSMPGDGTGGSVDIGCTDLVTLDQPVALRLYPVPSARPSGSATVTYDSSGRILNVELTAIALSPSATYTAALVAGTCAQEGKPEFVLDDLVADAQQQGHGVTQIHDVSAPPAATGWSVLVSTSSSTPVRPTLCGDLAPAP